MAFRPENIPLVARRFWTSDELPSFCSNTLACPLSGGHCQVYKLGFSDQTTWAVRIPIHARNAPKEVVTSELQCKIEVLELLDASGFKWAPKLIGHDLSYDNEVGFPLIVYSWVSGDPLKWNDAAPLHRCDRDKVLRQVIQIILQLIQCTKAKKGPTLDFLTDAVDRKFIRVFRNQLPGISLEDCLALRASLPEVVHGELDDAPFLISHGDLSSNNILVDNDYNITGIIDWGFATYQPFPLAGGLPRFLVMETEESLIPSSVTQQDRRSLVTHLSQCSCEYAPLLALMYGAADADYRWMVLEAVFSKGTHKWLADCMWFKSGSTSRIDREILEREMEAFLSGRVNLGANLTREQVCQCLPWMKARDVQHLRFEQSA
ncbi:kinase-like domain-containing protein [Talaromyces proteolyticus]|uniref:Kinase-like domain-containing protein n=1 Tax=Talaromyces proteolyticus TaxID=1131652 RepID=A0AAD4KJY9_9EURO|nr:kinase-like domain-containing protein [Talaromyces proteolyticus]KAH8690196.1 kinase-like domain-containing protein [Talaromyces proteolyticus]